MNSLFKKSLILLSLIGAISNLQAHWFSTITDTIRENKLATLMTVSTVVFGITALKLWQNNKKLNCTWLRQENNRLQNNLHRISSLNKKQESLIKVQDALIKEKDASLQDYKIFYNEQERIIKQKKLRIKAEREKVFSIINDIMHNEGDRRRRFIQAMTGQEASVDIMSDELMPNIPKSKYHNVIGSKRLQNLFNKH